MERILYRAPFDSASWTKSIRKLYSTAPMAQISSLCSTILDLPPSCLVFCPSRPEFCVVGTYFLHSATNDTEKRAPDESEDDGGDGPKTLAKHAHAEEGDDKPQAQETNAPQKRTGSLMIFHVDRSQSKIWIVSLNAELTIRPRVDRTENSTLTTPFAVLDAQWSPHPQQSQLLAVAASTGKVLIYRLDANSPEDTRLAVLDELVVADPLTLVLSLAWHPQNPSILGFTLSNGEVNICTFASSSSPSSPADATDTTAAQSRATSHKTLQIHNIHNHSLEAWTLAFPPSSWQSNGIFSGGDDQYLRFSPLASPSETAIKQNSTSTLSAPAIFPWQDRRIHSAGVTAILPLPLPPPLLPSHANLVVTGSYDDHIRLLRVPGEHKGIVQKRCEVLAELDLGGGVWRLKRIPSWSRELPGAGGTGRSGGKAGNEAGYTKDGEMQKGARVRSRDDGDPDGNGDGNEILILASCMHAGARIVALRHVINANENDDDRGEGDGDDNDEDEGWEFVVRARFEEHESMNYGSDVQPPLSPSPPGGCSSAEGASTHVIVSSSFYDRKVCLWEF